MENGILTTVQEKQLAEIVDNALKFKGVLELIDGYVARILISFLDNKVLDKLKDEIKAKLAALVDAVMAGDIELSETLAAEIINGLVDIPGLDEEAEGLIFRGAIEIAVGAILNKITELKGEDVVLKLY